MLANKASNESSAPSTTRDDSRFRGNKKKKKKKKKQEEKSEVETCRMAEVPQRNSQDSGDSNSAALNLEQSRGECA